MIHVYTVYMYIIIHSYHAWYGTHSCPYTLTFILRFWTQWHSYSYTSCKTTHHGLFKRKYTSYMYVHHLAFQMQQTFLHMVRKEAIGAVFTPPSHHDRVSWHRLYPIALKLLYNFKPFDIPIDDDLIAKGSMKYLQNVVGFQGRIQDFHLRGGGGGTHKVLCQHAH